MDEIALSKLTVTPELALEFFAVFSRLEYALKVGGFLQPGEGEAKADWHGFTRKLEETAFATNINPQLLVAFDYLTKRSPRHFAVRNGILGWFPITVPAGISQVDNTIRVIKQLRHNFFHGGKFAIDPDSSEDRDTKLLKYALEVLHEIRIQFPVVKREYES